MMCYETYVRQVRWDAFSNTKSRSHDVHTRLPVQLREHEFKMDLKCYAMTSISMLTGSCKYRTRPPRTHQILSHCWCVVFLSQILKLWDVSSISHSSTTWARQCGVHTQSLAGKCYKNKRKLQLKNPFASTLVVVNVCRVFQCVLNFIPRLAELGNSLAWPLPVRVGEQNCFPVVWIGITETGDILTPSQKGKNSRRHVISII